MKRRRFLKVAGLASVGTLIPSIAEANPFRLYDSYKQPLAGTQIVYHHEIWRKNPEVVKVTDLPTTMRDPKTDYLHWLESRTDFMGYMCPTVAALDKSFPEGTVQQQKLRGKVYKTRQRMYRDGVMIYDHFFLSKCDQTIVEDVA